VQIDRRLISHFDWTLFLLVLAFVLIGVTTIYSANYVVIQRHAGALPGRQLMWLGLGLIALFAALAFDYHYIDRIAYPFYGAMFLLLVLVLFLGHTGGGSQRWINLGFFRLQPSEPAKIAIVLLMAKYFRTTSRPGATICGISGRHSRWRRRWCCSRWYSRTSAPPSSWASSSSA